ncbi:amidohydrolase family protein [Agrilactobacillus composti]|uniref:amidohydrolase family protein n=1 Tax=Agrilactobacillus composti TaxID=398555 RepID=UPI00190F3939|nr:amidohydrolase family protein [Agrilactobacillus composti]
MGDADQVADETIDASHHIVYPGLVNTHHHLYQTFTRNLPQVQNMELFDWLTTLYKIWGNLDQTVTYYSAITGLGELLKSGCTTAFDHHYVFPSGEETGLIEAQFKAADDLGIRFHASRGSMSLSQKDGGLPPDNVVQTTDTILKDSDASLTNFMIPNLLPCTKSL